MLDTIAINLQRDEFTIHHPERFTPHAGALQRTCMTEPITS